jgi:membrane-associated phospholipid phosphatase
MEVRGHVPHNLLGPYTYGHSGTDLHVVRIVMRGFRGLDLDFAPLLWNKGMGIADSVAALPSLHFGSSMLFAVFLWSRTRWWLRPLLVAYPLTMAFSLVYSGEHYLTDCIAAALLVLLVHFVGNRIERRRAQRREAADRLDTLGSPPVSLEKPCPPSPSQRETMPSST